MRRSVLLFVLMLGILAGCTDQDPIMIIITPTPLPITEVAPTDSVETVIVPEAVVTETTVDTTSTNDANNQLEELPITEILEETTITGEFFGSIIGPDYTLPPTSTPQPTIIPATTEPTITPLPTATALPINTPITTPVNNVPSLNKDYIGLQLDWNMDIDSWFTFLLQAQKLDVKWIKLQANWAFMQPNSPDDYEQTFRLFEAHVQRAKNMGFNVMISVAKAPNWARSNNQDDGPPDDPQLLANFLRFMIERIKAENIAAIEVWNEPNLIREWNGGLPFNGSGYMQLFAPAYQAIREVAPSMPILVAGLAPTSTSDFSIDDRDFLQQMYDAGLGDYQDIFIGVHPYGWGNPPDTLCCDAIPDRGWDDDPHFFFLENLNATAEIMRRNNHNVQMWVTEFGWATWEGFPSTPPELWMTYTSAQQQADYTIRALEIGAQRDDIGVMILWNLNFAGELSINSSQEVAGYGIMYALPDTGIVFRPVFDRLQQILNP